VDEEAGHTSLQQTISKLPIENAVLLRYLWLACMSCYSVLTLLANFCWMSLRFKNETK
jgi:hypothetical protein